jgi:hypothetical protein
VQLATWNINGLRARLDYVKLWLGEREPDVVGFQELKMEDDKFPHDEFEALGYTCVTHGQKSWNGVAILSRLPLEHVESGLPGQEDFGARLIRARVGEGDARVDFTTLYCPNGKSVEHDDFPRKLAWFDALRDWATGFVDPEISTASASPRPGPSAGGTTGAARSTGSMASASTSCSARTRSSPACATSRSTGTSGRRRTASPPPTTHP